MELLIGTDPINGLEVYRQLDYFVGGVIEEKITVYYRQWFVSPNGTKLEPTLQKKYHVIDIPAVTRIIEPVLITPEVLDEDQITILIPAVYSERIIEIVTPSKPFYTGWRQKVIPQQAVGATLGNDLIIGSINETLIGLPIDIIDGYCIHIT